ncbi:MAG: hypothetical protein ACRENK_15060 [Gemmatimonadaceae bacterium]
MPVTAKLSKALYDQLGEAVVNELVDWFNQVDATYRADLKDFNDVNFARFDAKLDAMWSEFDTKLDALRSELDTKLDTFRSEFDTKLDTLIARMEAQLEKRLGEQTRFFFLAWAILLASNIALWFR